MKRTISALAALLVLAPAASAQAATLSAPTARKAALAAERANARLVARKSPRLSPTGSHVGSCRRVSATVVRCATRSTFRYRSAPNEGVVVDKVMTRAIVTVCLRGNRVVVRHRSR